MAAGLLCSAAQSHCQGGSNKTRLFSNTSASVSGQRVTCSTALGTVMLYSTKSVRYHNYYKCVNVIMNNVGLLGRTQCRFVSAKQSDVAVCDCDWAKCLFWERAWLRVSYIWVIIYKFSYWKKEYCKAEATGGAGSRFQLPGFSTALSDKNTINGLVSSVDNKLFRICFLLSACSTVCNPHLTHGIQWYPVLGTLSLHWFSSLFPSNTVP